MTTARRLEIDRLYFVHCNFCVVSDPTAAVLVDFIIILLTFIFILSTSSRPYLLNVAFVTTILLVFGYIANQ